MTYHEKQKGQSKEVFRLKGGMHVRRSGKDVTRIRVDDTLHISKEEAEKFGDKFELVDLTAVVTAEDVTVEEETVEDEVVEDEVVEEETVEEETATEESDSIDRQDFSSDAAFNAWTEADEPDLGNVPRTGHGGRTYSVKDVKSAL